MLTRGDDPPEPPAISPGGTHPPGPPLGGAPPPRTPLAPGKFGAYAEDAEVFGWIRQGAPAGRRCLEAQVMDWADDVAYSVHDLEDGFHAGLITFENLKSPAERVLVSRTTATTYCDDGVSEAELTEILDELLALDMWPDSYDGGPATAAALKNLTSELIGRFCVAAQQATISAARLTPSSTTSPSSHTSPIGHSLTRYAADLMVPRRQRLECALLKGITAHYVMTRAGVIAAQARERELLTELGPCHRARRPPHAGPAAAPGLGRGRNRCRAPPGHHRPGGLAHRHVGHRLASPPLRARRVVA